jgi:hypothetical protein
MIFVKLRQNIEDYDVFECMALYDLDNCEIKLKSEIINWLESYNIEYYTADWITSYKRPWWQEKYWYQLGIIIIFQNLDDEMLFKLTWY